MKDWQKNFDWAIYEGYARLALPRHTSYPAATYWKESFPSSTFVQYLSDSLSQSPISLYIHIPFCAQLCFYCACNKLIVPKNDPKATSYGEHLLQGIDAEMRRISEMGKAPVVQQMHFGGGTPTWLSTEQLETLFTSIRKYFTWNPEAEISVELDPRVSSREHLQVLRDFGVNRISLGIQDFDPRVQKAVNREQSFAMIADFVEQCRAIGFKAINFDLIYGLPFQTESSMQETLSKVIQLDPSRIAFYRLAMIPEIFKWQRRFAAEDMPNSAQCLKLNLQAINSFTDAGYRFIGLDHFVKANDSLAKAFDDRTITRSFQGMTTGRGLPVIAVGPSAISQLPMLFAQNIPDFFQWSRQAPDNWTTARGMVLNEDDALRRELINDLYCYREIDKAKFESRMNQAFEKYFAQAMIKLKGLEQDGLVHLNADKIILTRPLGELLLRVVAACFDRYLPNNVLQTGIAGKASQVG